MAASNPNRQDLLGRIDQLLQEAYGLPRSTESWERRLYIDWELFQLFRRIANGADTPQAQDTQHLHDEHPKRPHRHDPPARFPF